VGVSELGMTTYPLQCKGDCDWVFL